ncbi:MAG: GNAT family N-acetyltransferase [Pseudomonadota bacterium]|nr:GNAT family N-acetyltransferase [Pseudomonadota bacterium]
MTTTPTKAFTTDPVLVDVPMPIITPRLIIRPVQAGDGKTIAEASAETLDQLYLWMDWARNREDAGNPELKEIYARKAWSRFQNREDLSMIGIERTTGTPVVFTGLHGADWRIRRFEIGYWIRKSAQGKGYATEAANALLRYAFGALSARVVTIGHAEGNEASRAIIEKLGFTHAIRQPWNCEMPDGTLVDGHGYYRTHTEGLPPLDVTWGKEP